jgi:hypothetical protein
MLRVAVQEILFKKEEMRAMKKKLQKGFIGGLCTLVMCALLLAGCANMTSQPSSNPFPNLFQGSKAKIQYEIAPEAEVTMARHFIGPYQEKDWLQFEIAIKNVSDKEHRYKAIILLDEGAVAGGYFPNKPKKGTKGLKPGETDKQTLPIYYDKDTNGFLLKVETAD